jgi:Uma2 family endonuclease
MARVAERSGISPADFLTWERAHAERHEFFRGEVFAMAGGSPRHNALCANVSAALHSSSKGSPCHVYSSDQRIGIGQGQRYVYADLSVTCGPIALEPGTTDVITNPSVVVEVLSSSTEQYDRGMTWEGYQGLASLTDYVLVSQAEPRIEHFRRQGDGQWIYQSAGPGGRVTLSTGAVLRVDDIFADTLDIAGES